MAVPQVIDTYLTDEQADALKDKLDNLLLVDIPHDPFIDVNRGSCYNQAAFDLVTSMVAKADLS